MNQNFMKKKWKRIAVVSAEELLIGIINIFESGIFLIRSKSVYDFDDDYYYYFFDELDQQEHLRICCTWKDIQKLSKKTNSKC